MVSVPGCQPPSRKCYLGASPTAAGPQTGMGLPNGLRRRKFQSSEIPVFRIFDKIAENEFSKRVFEESFCRKCSWRAYATFHRRMSHYLHEGLFPSLNRLFSCCFEVPISNSEPNVCFRMAYRCLGGGLKGRLAPLGFDLGL